MGFSNHLEGHKAPTIARLLWEEGVKVSRVGISKFLVKFEETGSIGRIEDRIWQTVENNSRNEETIVEDQMHWDIEPTVYQLHKLLMSKDNSACISLRTVLFVN